MWMFRKDAPLLLNLSPSWHKYSWIAEFLGSIPQYKDNTVATARLAIAARERLFGWARDEGIDFDVEHRGIMHVYRKRKNFEHARRVNALLAEGGLLREELSPADIAQVEPTLQGDWHGGFLTPSDASGDIHRYTVGLAKAAARRGVRFRYGTDVVQLDLGRTGGVKVRTLIDSERYDATVICAGCASRHFARQVGDRVNVYPVKGYSITVNLDDEESRAGAPMVSLLDDETKLVSSRLGPDRFRVAGTAEFSGFNRDIRAGRTAPLTKWVETHFPQVSTERVVPWAGLRPMMPNMMPKVGPGRAPGIFYNTGHGHLGWTLAAATAEATALAIAGPEAMQVAEAA
jgi:D-amino-acid dehydrogenase